MERCGEDKGAAGVTKYPGLASLTRTEHPRVFFSLAWRVRESADFIIINVRAKKSSIEDFNFHKLILSAKRAKCRLRWCDFEPCDTVQVEESHSLNSSTDRATGKASRAGLESHLGRMW